MKKNNYNLGLQRYLRLFMLLFVAFSATASLWSQATVRVRVVSVQAVNNTDCDGFLNGDSDFVWEFIARDNTLGRTNNNPSALGGLLGDFNHAYVNGDNGPYTHSVASPRSGGGFNPNNGIYFDYDYVCAGDVPTSMRIDWQAYDNDDLIFNYSLGLGGMDGETGGQILNMLVPALPGTVTQTVFANSTDPGCNQRYAITFEVTHAALAVTAIPDDICSATLIPVDGTVRRFAWCPNATLEAGEPRRGDVANNRSRWFYFVAPASGRVDISTDHSATDFGTYFEIYHAADGAGCTAGLNPFGTLVKNKFEYLSYVDFADAGGFLGTSGQADINFDDCSNILTSNPLVAGEVYYIQMTTDNANERGFIGISISNLGGSPAEAWDIPCRGTNTTASALSTTPRTFDLGSPVSANLSFSCATDRETGDAYFGIDPTQFQAYDYNHNATNNGTIHESTWARFTAPNSGRIYFEGDVRGAFNLNETENTALFGHDSRFAPGRPADYSCGNLSNLSAAEGGTGIFGANSTAIIRQSCLEPGYTYYGMIDPSGAATGSTANVWFYDPSVSDPNNNPPSNDILCLTLNDTLYEVPVVPVDSVIPFAAVAGDNTRACIERLAGEPVSNTNAALRADQTVWHYFTAPASGVADIRLRAYIGMARMNYAIYPLLNGTDCYGGLRPATFTQNGQPTGNLLTPIAQGSTDFNGTTIGLCCLIPGARYAIQIDGGSPGDQGQYIIEFIREVEVYAGDSRYVTQNNDTINYNSLDTAYICRNDSIFPSVMLNPLGVTTTQIPSCMSVGYVLHTSFPTPEPVANIGFVYIDSTRAASPSFVNDGNGSGTFGNPFLNQVYYVSALADESSSWGRLTCTSASIENGAPVVFLSAINVAQTYNSTTCAFSFTLTGGLPAFNGTNFNYTITNAGGDTIFQGQVAHGVAQIHNVPAAGVYTVFITDGASCETIFNINATPCLDPCINNPVVITPSPTNNTIYTCQPNGTAVATLQLNGGDATINGTPYVVIVSGSTVAGANGTFAQAPTGGAVPTPFTFQVGDNDAWQVIVADANGCRDTVVGTFLYNATTCPNFCSLNPIVVTTAYTCLPNRTALVEVTISGGVPSVNGSDYLVSISGSTVFGQTFSNAQLPGVVGGSQQFSFLVDDGDTWQLIVADTAFCADTSSATYNFNVINCPNICTLLPVSITPDPIISSVYSCNPNGTATVTLNLSGGDPVLSGSQYTVEVSGSTVAGANGTFTSGIGTFSFSVADGDAWQVILIDVNDCRDTAAATFDFTLVNCPTLCNLLNINAASSTYSCNSNGTATVSVVLEGGLPAYNGSNYFVTVSGTTASNVNNAPVAGVIGGQVVYQFVVNDGDAWQIRISDSQLCADSLGGSFNFNSLNCPDFCALRPITLAASNYTCDFNGNAIFTVTIGGGRPSYDASDYTLVVSGSRAGSNTVGTGLAGVVNGTVTYTITVTDGDNWQIFVSDNEDCQNAIQGAFFWNATNCGNICSDPLYTTVAINNGQGFQYDCDGQGGALLTFNFTEGLPALDGGSTDYIAVATINGATTSYNVNSNGIQGSLTIGLINGDSWSLSVWDALGCDTISIATNLFNTVNAVAETDAIGDLLVGQFANLIGSSSTGGGITYSWTPTQNVTNPTTAVTPVQPLQTTFYTLEVRDTLGCTDTDSVEVRVGSCVPLHAGFTPNGDGTNDTWVIPCLTLFDNETQVYNRWGQLVFSMVNYDGSWDGTSGGQDLPPAAYYYVISVTYPNLAQPVVYKGTVTILR
jgi:gliding motility-associated-like protein